MLPFGCLTIVEYSSCIASTFGIRIANPVVAAASSTAVTNHLLPLVPSFCTGTALRMMSSSSSSHEQQEKATIREQKQSLRKRVRSTIKELKDDEIKIQSQKVWDQVVQLPVWKEANSVGLFLSMPNGEICTDPILKQAIQSGKDVYVPQVGKDFNKCDMDLLKVIVNYRSATSQSTFSDDDDDDDDNGPLFYETWPKNKWRIPEPPTDMPIKIAKPGDIDLLIVPGLAFDRNLNRLGQGKGYYDRFIEKMRIDRETETGDNEGSRPLPLLAVGLQPQLVEDEVGIPVDEYDIKMDMVVLPEETITQATTSNANVK